MPDLAAILRDAAEIARRASTTLDDRQVVEIVVTEVGLIARGTYRDALTAYSAEADVEWSQLDVNPHFPIALVSGVVAKLDARARDLGHEPVRNGA